MAAAAPGVHGGEFDPRFQEWSFIFSLKDKNKKKAVANSSVQSRAVIIKFKWKKQGTTSILEGSVQQLFKRKEHHGLLIQLFGIVGMGEKVFHLLSAEKTTDQKSSSVIQQLCSPSDQQAGHYVTNAYQKFPFSLPFPLTDEKGQTLPPSISSNYTSVQYKLVVFMRVNESFKLLGEQIVEYQGQLSQTLQLEKSEIAISKEFHFGTEGPGTISLSQKEFLLGENIPFQITIRNGEVIKKISLLLVQITTSKKGESEQAVLDVVTFKRFLGSKKEFSRTGRFSGKTIPTASFIGKNRFGLKLEYFLQVVISTRDGQQGLVESVKVLICTDEAALSATAPDLCDAGVDATAPADEEDDFDPEEEPQPSAPRISFKTWATSILSLLPPSYSQLPSRAESLLSLETLPPDYDDLEFEESKSKIDDRD